MKTVSMLTIMIFGLLYANILELTDICNLNVTSRYGGGLGAIDYLEDGTDDLYVMERIEEDNQVNWYMVVYSEAGSELTRVLLKEDIDESSYIVGIIENLSSLFTCAGNQYLLVPYLDFLHDYASQHSTNEANLVFNLYSYPGMSLLSSASTDIIELLDIRSYEFYNVGLEVLDNKLFFSMRLGYYGNPPSANTHLFRLHLENEQLVFDAVNNGTGFQLYRQHGLDEILSLNYTYHDNDFDGMYYRWKLNMLSITYPDSVRAYPDCVCYESKMVACLNAGMNQSTNPIFSRILYWSTVPQNILQIHTTDGLTIWSASHSADSQNEESSKGFSVNMQNNGNCFVEYVSPWSNQYQYRASEQRGTIKLRSSTDGSIIEESATPVLFDFHVTRSAGLRYLYSKTEDGMEVYKLTIAGVPNDENEIPVPSLNLTNYPNPFNPETTIIYNLAKPSKVSLNIYNVKRQLVKSLVNESQKAGTFEILWNGTDSNEKAVGSGVYLYKLETDNQVQTGKAVLLK
ncbi:MAG: T9SS type A sorting domain-containing protein [Candidatus Cloacimonetes bacterium]|nr:T9SS type A sorting domain-containing protein [Candidatus Cloacimonadota bacterium]